MKGETYIQCINYNEVEYKKCEWLIYIMPKLGAHARIRISACWKRGFYFYATRELIVEFTSFGD